MIIKNFAEFVNEDWGSSDQSIMNQSIHKSLGNPKNFPGLSQILDAAEDAVDFYWSDWPEYRRERDELINKAGRYYMAAYFPALFKGFVAMFAESIDERTETFESFLLLAEAWRLNPEPKDDMRISDIVKKSAGNEEKEISLAQRMANSIKDGDKAIRRARAAFEKGLAHIAKPFYLKAKDLGYDYHLSDAELKLTESKETQIFDEVGTEMEALRSKLDRILKRTTDTDWIKKIKKSLELLDKMDSDLATANDKLGVIPVNESQEGVKREAISRLADFFRVSPSSLVKFKFDGADNIKELTKALNSTSDQGTELYYKTAIKLAKEELGIKESVDEAMVQVAGKDKPSGAQVLATVVLDYLIEDAKVIQPGDINRKKLIAELQKLIMDSTF